MKTALRSLFAGSLLLLVACQPTPSPEPAGPSQPTAQRPFRLLVVDDPTLAKAIEAEWAVRLDQDLEIREMTTEQLADARFLGADAVVYPTEMLGDLAERQLILPLEQEDLDGPQLAQADLFPLSGEAECRWGLQRFAVPLGSPSLVVLYRKDWFEQLKLTPPQTWKQWGEVAKRLRDPAVLGEISGQPDWVGVAEPRKGRWAARLLLARAAAYARQTNQYATVFDFDSLAAKIDTPPFVRALEELAQSASKAPLNPDECVSALQRGKAAMVIGWPSALGSIEEGQQEAWNQVAFARLPGSGEAYGVRDGWHSLDEVRHVPLLGISGRLGSVTKEARKPKSAVAGLAWISGRDWGAIACSKSPHTTLFRHSQLEQPERWLPQGTSSATARSYAELVKQSRSAHVWLDALRLPAHDEYLASLSQAVSQVLEKQATAAEALSIAADQWDAITQERGPAQQRSAYLRSLGLEP